MNMKWVAAGLAAIAVLTVGWVIFLSPTLDKTLRQAYGKPTVTNNPNWGGKSVRFQSADDPVKVAKRITKTHKPSDRRTNASGIYLRYRDKMVSVTNRAKGGSNIYLEDTRVGYNHFYGHVGGYYGTYSGPAGTFRGRGPGDGK